MEVINVMIKNIVVIFMSILFVSAVFTAIGENLDTAIDKTNRIIGTHTMSLWADKDAYIDDLPGMDNENHGNEGCLIVARESGEWPYQAYTLIRFNLDEIPGDAVITQATLWMTPIEGRFAQLELLTIIEPWNEYTVTWDNQPSTPTGPHIANINDPQMFIWDVTPLVQNWRNGVIANHGIKIVPYTTAYYYTLSFHDRFDINWETWPRIDLIYEGSPPPDWDPPDVPDDTATPSISISISPPNPGPGDLVHIAAYASDDVGLRWMRLSVTNPSTTEEWNTEAHIGETPRALYIDQIFPIGPHDVIAEVRDVAGKYNTVSDSFEVQGSGTEPVLSISATPSEIWIEDGNFVNISITASDPEGIRYLVVGLENGFFSPDTFPDHGEYLIFDPPYPTMITHEFSAVNLDVPHRFNPLSHDYTELLCRAHVQDGEYLWSGIQESSIPTIRPYQWDFGLPYSNPTRNTLPWQTMYDIFSEGECWGPGSLHWWKRIVALETYGGPEENGVKYLAKGGECVGMSCFSIMFAAHDTAIPNYFTHSGTDGYISPDLFYPYPTHVQRTIERFQGAQFSDGSISTFWPQFRDQRYGTLDTEALYRPFVDNQIPRIIDDINNGTQGYISINRERKYSSDGHAVVPWFATQLPTGVWRIYIYDCNRPDASLFNETFTSFTRTHEQEEEIIDSALDLVIQLHHELFFINAVSLFNEDTGLWEDIVAYSVIDNEIMISKTEIDPHHSNARVDYLAIHHFNDYDYYELYPYIDITPWSFSFFFQGTQNWDGMIAYVPYNTAVKNDYDLPDGLEYFWVIG
jgi:hypothetical protein